MQRATFNFAPTSKARSPRDTVLEDAMAFVGWEMSDARNLGRMLRGFKGKTPNEIRRHMSTARQEGKVPPALFLVLMGIAKRNKQKTPRVAPDKN